MFSRMNSSFFYALLIFFFNVNFTNSYANNSLEDYSTFIENLINNSDPNINIGIYVEDLKTGKEVYSLNADRVFPPASLTKSFTTLGALAKLGPEYTFKTSILSTKNNDSEHHDLYLRFSGNPLLKLSQLEDLLAQLKTLKEGDKIRNFYIDDFKYTLPHYPPGVMMEDFDYCYASPISAAIINKNGVYFSIKPSRYINDSAELKKVHNKYDDYLTHNIITKRSCDAAKELKVKRSDNGYHLYGCINKKNKNMSLCLSTYDLRAHVKMLVESALKELDINVSGEIGFAKTPTGAKVVTEHNSESLLTMLRYAMKNSNNLVTNAIFLAAFYDKSHTEWEDVGANLKKYLQEKLSLDFDKVKFESGAGFTRGLITPRVFAKFLKTTYNSKYKSNFISTHTVAGQDGSLKKRMKNLPGNTKFYGKTGSSATINNVAGYLYTPNKDYIVVVMVNNFVGGREIYSELIDGIITYTASL